MIAFAPELELLRACLRCHVLDCPAGDELAPVVAKVRWDRLLWLGGHEGALLPLQHALKALVPACSYPPAVAAQLLALRETYQLRLLARGREACQIQDLFDRHAIRAALTDAWMIAQCCGRHPPLIEFHASFDYVAPSGDAERAAAVLAGAGHPLDRNPEQLIKPGLSPARINRGIGEQFAATDFWPHTGKLELGGRKLHHPAFTHWLLLKAIEGSRCRSEMTLGNAAEIALLSRNVPGEAWAGVWAEAAHFGVEAAFCAAVAEGHRQLGLPVPENCGKFSGGHADSGQVPRAAPAKDPQSLNVPYLPTPPPVLHRMLALAETGPADLVCDLGCGDGRIVIEAAKAFQARATGIDCDPTRIAEATSRAADAGVADRTAFICDTLFAADISDASVITLYLLPQLMPLIQRKLLTEAKPGTRIVSHDYSFPDWPPEKTEIIRVGPLKVSQIYLWRIP